MASGVAGSCGCGAELADSGSKQVAEASMRNAVFQGLVEAARDGEDMRVEIAMHAMPA